MHLIWHMRVPLIFAPCGTITWGERGWAPHSTNSLSPCDCATYANMRDSLICNMRCIYLLLFSQIINIIAKLNIVCYLSNNNWLKERLLFGQILSTSVELNICLLYLL